LVQSFTDQAPTDAFCRATLGVACYSPQEIWNAYGLTGLLKDGYTGTGQTIVIIDSFGSPTIASDLHTFDMAYGLPDPPSFQIIAPLGTVPFDPNNSAQVSWAGESTLDVEWAHALAPGANIVLLTSPVNETQGVPGMPEFLELETYALNHRLGKIISQSWGTPENGLFASASGIHLLGDFESFYIRAAQEKVTVLAGAGDNGSTGIELDGVTLYPMRVANFPASSPLVTAVGGTNLYATTEGKYLAESVWNDAFGRGGGGVSQYFAEPSYQKTSLPQQDQVLLNGFRGLPDISYNADCNSAIQFYESYIQPSGFYITCGTSEGPPQWAGIIAIANQLAGYPLGFLNERLYQLGRTGVLSDAMHDVVLGSNSDDFFVPGYFATPGWDLASGWGTPRADKLVRALVQEH
jgi:subtilase family serine protease